MRVGTTAGGPPACLSIHHARIHANDCLTHSKSVFNCVIGMSVAVTCGHSASAEKYQASPLVPTDD